ncbi:hypothetical protein [Streptomyces nodosus]|uniref:hypothetical protein n=1 Tax=Streptomyces nodosus TaxID=40318 RepID=UPI00380C8C4E
MSLPPVEPDAFELFRARMNFDRTGKSLQAAMALAGLSGAIGCGIAAVQFRVDMLFLVVGVLWVFVLAYCGIEFVVMRTPNLEVS